MKLKRIGSNWRGVVGAVAAFICSAVFTPDAIASHGIYQDYVIWSNNGGGNQYYHGGAGANSAWSGAGLGSYNLASGNLTLQGSEIDTYDDNIFCGGDQVYQADFLYRVYKQGSTAPGFTDITLGFRSRTGANQKWDQTAQNINLLALAAATGGGSGTYTVEVYFRDYDSYQCSGTYPDYDNNGGNNYIATFSFNAPAISTSGSLSAVSTTYGTASSTTSFSVSGANMAADILVTPPAGFEISQSSSSGFGSTTMVGSSGTISSTTVYVRLAATTAAGTYSGNVVCSSSSATSVNVATVSSTVSPKALTAQGTLSISSKVYNGATGATPSGSAALQATEAIGSGSAADGKPYSADSVSLTGTASYAYNSKDVATATTATESGLSLTGTGNGNYTLTAPTISAGITPKALKYTGISAANKIYNGNQTAALSGTAATLTAEAAGGSTSDGAPYIGDTVSFTTGTLTGTFANKDVANGIAVTLTGGVTLTAGGQSADYSVGSPNTAPTANITALPVTLSGSRNYDGTTTAASSILTVANAVGSDTVTVASGSATLASANGGLQTISSIGSLALGNNSSGDYTLTGASGSVTINPAPGSFSISTTENNEATFAASKIAHYASDAGVTLSVSGVAATSAQSGTASLSGGNITYTPATGYTGSDSFTYTLNDGVGGSSTGTVNVTVNAANVSSRITTITVDGSNFATLTASGLPSTIYDVQASDDLGNNWSTIDSVTASGNGLISYTDPNSPSHTSRYYRLAQH